MRTLAFVRIKRVHGGEYYQLVESRRVEGKPRQRVLVHLGSHPTVEEAVKEWPKEIRRLRRYAGKERATAISWGESAKNTAAYKNAIKRADGADKKADNLQANVEKLRQLRKQGVV